MADFSQAGLKAVLLAGIGSERYSAQIDRAFELAFKGHRGQVREHVRRDAPRVPYIVHPVGVAIIAAELIQLAGLSDEFDDVMSACLTHDLLEDTPLSLQELERATSRRTAEIVLALTKPPLESLPSRSERNRKFVQQIINAGRTAMFVKVCDFLHNISRPSQSPTNLLDKALKKGQSDYQRFFEEGHLSDGLRQQYVQRLLEAERVRSNLRMQQTIANDQFTFEEAVAYCQQKSATKVLERHDIADVVGTLVGAQLSIFASADDYLNTVLPRSGISKAAVNQARAFMRTGELDISKVGELSNYESLADVTKVLVFPLILRALDEEGETLVVALSKKTTPRWATRPLVSTLVTILSEKLKLRAGHRITDVANDLEHIGLMIEPSLALKAGLSYEELATLKGQVDAATFVNNALSRALQPTLVERAAFFNIERVESRVKTAASIVRKIVVRKSLPITEIDDLVGYRIICLSRADTNSVAEHLYKVISENNSGIRYQVPIISESIERANVTSDAGYVGIHIRFLVRGPVENHPPVSCELQIRTVFQDAWSRVSHLIDYKSGRSSRQRVNDSWDQLAKLRDAADDIIVGLK